MHILVKKIIISIQDKEQLELQLSEAKGKAGTLHALLDSERSANSAQGVVQVLSYRVDAMETLLREMSVTQVQILENVRGRPAPAEAQPRSLRRDLENMLERLGQ